ncbi:translation initiation factor IF-2 [Juglans regia]|uniref:Translation initiation factor IF-2 n=2 Tax=Juglans regia TaxID=51240 RepID=A0A2I4EYR0_JUGRE|nr:translation initiation factor IF-2 [Juglans regia]
MRGSIGRTLSRPNPIGFSNATRRSLIPFSTSSSSPTGGGGGRGRGRGSGSPQFDFASPGKPEPDEPESKIDPPPPGTGLGHGHGRGRPVPSSPTLPNFSSFISSIKPPPAGRGHSVPPPPDSAPKEPIFFKKEDGPANLLDAAKSFTDRNLPPSILPVSTGRGRGKPLEQPSLEAQFVEENRHTRARKSLAQAQTQTQTQDERGRAPRMTREEAVKNAVKILSRGGGDGDGDIGDSIGGVRGGGRGGYRGRGAPGRGRGRGLYRGRGRGRAGDSKEDAYGAGLYLGDNADGEKLAKRLGVENMNQLVEGFEEMSGAVLPSPLEDALVDAMDVNYAIECEPEYLMGEFDQNPDIDDKPPIPLRDALEKMKPFLMAYEGIQSQEEWEEIMKETMERVPLLKEIVDYYSGPDRVTAKQQQEELERVAKTVPISAPDSVKRFADRAVISLQSNPGWGFDKKCQFMDKLVGEVSHHYK